MTCRFALSALLLASAPLPATLSAARATHVITVPQPAAQHWAMSADMAVLPPPPTGGTPPSRQAPAPMPERAVWILLVIGIGAGGAMLRRRPLRVIAA